MPAELSEIWFLLDGSGALVVYQEKDTSWLGVLAFSNEAAARAFVDASRLEVSDIVAIATSDAQSIAGLIAQVKKRLVRNLLLDLDYATGECTLIEFEGDRLGATRSWRFEPRHKTR
ncbi:MAG TPA: hypothetical protein VMT64_01945 [Candidatus Binataceae bacterium]|nr:hypothetical protein [Candidatus Binataceae bacterium]